MYQPVKEEVKIEVGNRLEKVKGQPKQAFIKIGEQIIGTVLVWNENPGEHIKLNAAGKFWLHDLLTK